MHTYCESIGFLSGLPPAKKLTGVVNVRWRRPGEGVDLAALLQRLGTLGINRLMVEGGARIITSFLRERLVDFLVLTVSPLLVGGIRAVHNLAENDSPGFARLRQPHRVSLGDDLILWGELGWEEM
jgi:riboflavin biosynthesis pyrimidine reductase